VIRNPGNVPFVCKHIVLALESAIREISGIVTSPKPVEDTSREEQKPTAPATNDRKPVDTAPSNSTTDKQPAAVNDTKTVDTSPSKPIPNKQPETPTQELPAKKPLSWRKRLTNWMSGKDKEEAKEENKTVIHPKPTIPQKLVKEEKPKSWKDRLTDWITNKSSPEKETKDSEETSEAPEKKPTWKDRLTNWISKK
jgi:hypothetical protein